MGLLLLIEVFIQKNLRFGIFKAQVFYVECVSKMGWVLSLVLRLWVDFFGIDNEIRADFLMCYIKH
jgi:hypothetical protein